jgi:hypothetical protein
VTPRGPSVEEQQARVAAFAEGCKCTRAHFEARVAALLAENERLRAALQEMREEIRGIGLAAEPLIGVSYDFDGSNLRRLDDIAARALRASSDGS